ncbi:hypothetical protein CJ030_MR2G002702 [Morella rubra]|uniref:Uncharacterized protein n=1 Tax=Morella rubra TaxID=262757 RepID=A0A6A1WGY3_9ROSI|nr:hypothetical protein CJ030_MR2G002702 [Morella rubra]
MTEMKLIPRGGPITGDGTDHSGIVQATIERIVVGIPGVETSIRGVRAPMVPQGSTASPVPRIEDFSLVDVDPALLHVVPSPPAVPVEGNEDNKIIDLTSDIESDID